MSDNIDMQNLNVSVPREIILMVRDIKKTQKCRREDVVINAIRDAHAKMSTKPAQNLSVKNKVGK